MILNKEIFIVADTEITDERLLEKSERLGKEWRTVGILLGLTWKQLDQIKMENSGNQQHAAYCMLQKWWKSDVEASLTQLDSAVELSHNLHFSLKRLVIHTVCSFFITMCDIK